MSGANRFLPSKPPEPWADLRDASAYRAQAPQSRVSFPVRPELAELWDRNSSREIIEDCLSLNVWTPSLDRGARRPVVVWFHGGAFSFGLANHARLTGSWLARHGDVVLVTVNQRLNIFGDLDLSEFGGAELAQSGNAGTRDMIAALEWVREHIEAFGGQPGMSQSSGNRAAARRSAR